MKNNQITITLPKEIWDNTNVELERQKEKIEELIKAKFVIVDQRWGLAYVKSYPDNESFTEALGDIVLPSVEAVGEQGYMRHLVKEAKRKSFDFERSKTELEYKIKNYNQLPWWRKIFTFNL